MSNNGFSVYSDGIKPDGYSYTSNVSFAECTVDGKSDGIVFCDRKSEVVYIHKGGMCNSIVKYKKHEKGLEIVNMRFKCRSLLDRGFSSSTIAFIEQ